MGCGCGSKTDNHKQPTQRRGPYRNEESRGRSNQNIPKMPRSRSKPVAMSEEEKAEARVLRLSAAEHRKQEGENRGVNKQGKVERQIQKEKQTRVEQAERDNPNRGGGGFSHMNWKS